MNHRPKCKIIQLLEGNMGENSDGLGQGDAFLDTKPKKQSMKKLISWT